MVVPVPDKAYFKIGEVATIAGVKPSVLRYWESEFPTLRPAKSPAGHRVYSRGQVEHVLVLRELLHVRKLTLAGARRAIHGEAAASAASAADLVEIENIARELLQLTRE